MPYSSRRTLFHGVVTGSFLLTSIGCIPPEPVAIEPTLASIQEHIFTPSCAVSGCHGGTEPIHGWDLSNEQASYETLVYSQSNIVPTLNLVEPGDPDNSFLIHKLEGTADTPSMPFGLPRLESYKIAAVREWISSLPVTPQPTLIYLQRNVFDVSCATAGCHSGDQPAAGMNLSAGSSLASMVGIPSTQSPLNIIEPGDPDNSYLVQQLETGAMPQGGPMLSEANIAAVRGWISSLTPPQASMDWIQQNIFSPTCAFSGCHDDVNPDAGLDLTAGNSLSAMLSVPSTQQPGVNLIEPGAPDDSYLIHKLEGSNMAPLTVQMPWLLPQLPAEQITAIRDWISALEPAPSDPFTDIQQTIFTPRCTGCHGTNGGMSLQEGESLQNLINVPAQGNPLYLRVAPGDADNSYLMMKLRGLGSGLRMPPTGALSTEDLAKIENWINSLQ